MIFLVGMGVELQCSLVGEREGSSTKLPTGYGLLHEEAFFFCVGRGGGYMCPGLTVTDDLFLIYM